MDAYGSKVFDGDSQEDIIEKAKSVRNRVVHVNKKQKDYLSGEECGVYIYKFALLYRHIVLSLLGVKESNYIATIEKWIIYFNSNFDAYRIKVKKR